MDDITPLVDEHLEVLMLARFKQCRADADLVRRLAALHALDRSGKEYVREDVAAALSWTFASTRDRMRDAVTLTMQFPATVDAMAEGCLTLPHARALLEMTVRLDDDVAARVERRVLRTADAPSLSTWRGRIRDAIAKLDPRGEADRHDDARADRRLAGNDETDGMGSLWVDLPAEDQHTVLAAVQACADATPADGRSADQRRVDALVSICCGYLTGPTGAVGGGTGSSAFPAKIGTWQGRKPTVEVTVALSTLLCLDDQPGWLAGYGPIPAHQARRIAADATGTWRRLVTDDLGRLIDYGTTRYRPPTNLRDFVIARDRTCRMPDCNRAARRCDVDHCRERANGGATCEHNLHCLCPRHHALRHETTWTFTRPDDGSTRWNSPSGRRYIQDATTLPADTTTAASANHRRSTPTTTTTHRRSDPRAGRRGRE